MGQNTRKSTKTQITSIKIMKNSWQRRIVESLSVENEPGPISSITWLQRCYEYAGGASRGFQLSKEFLRKHCNSELKNCVRMLIHVINLPFQPYLSRHYPEFNKKIFEYFNMCYSFIFVTNPFRCMKISFFFTFLYGLGRFHIKTLILSSVLSTYFLLLN